jgi:transcriptional regulator with XRE-family HTH domain
MSDKVKTTKSGVVHKEVEHVLSKIGMNISYARPVQRLSAQDIATRLAISRATLHRLEIGDPGISLNTLAVSHYALGRLDTLRDIIDPAKDDVTIMQMREQAPNANSEEAPNVSRELNDPASKYEGFRG